ncbi:MAG: 1,2-phenylacetyl-CoA epoxidase subunit PaaD [Armatimonadota bacterium]|nr:1,2-phenylacetyl-CoA epoxidase subunit PaaD [Armatimonadota bacterium]MDR7467140.1 1,2-phenylacetyl-CoA epoxidase subunit PaaD [Armatimonadota bacterium]MDR7499326.1 1,2-phenylacetyl-CoA epoxidase subunit PaaD [Armatimonadota bacterium]MDR7558338.1 1,2-phenylacetyl-CoA epoxidase subunit PaaD [Armatimonadota bacterium]MDR7572471.1 1,2-phenylacetyl-CoA epoxidase subunit PaaD [Armatimonadota bacterium]
MTQPTATERAVWEALETIEDPELPIAITDLGLIGGVRVDAGTVQVTLVPTFSACPAIGVIREEIRSRLLALPGVRTVEVDLAFAEPWTMSRMSERGRARLIHHGLSVPARHGGGGVECPFCGSTNTTLENPFGPTLCRAIYYCLDCRNPIERFRPPAD